MLGVLFSIPKRKRNGGEDMKKIRKETITNGFSSSSCSHNLLYNCSFKKERLKIKHRISNETVFYLQL